MDKLTLNDVRHCLPEVVLEMIDVLGFADTQQVIDKFGGTRLYFMDKAHYYKLIKDTINEDVAKKMRDFFRTESVYIPRCEVALRLLRNLQFKAEYDYLTNNGVSGRMAMVQLCPKYNITDRTGWLILKQNWQQAYQQDLF